MSLGDALEEKVADTFPHEHEDTCERLGTEHTFTPQDYNKDVKNRWATTCEFCPSNPSYPTRPDENPEDVE